MRTDTLDVSLKRLRSELDRVPIAGYSTCTVIQADLRAVLTEYAALRKSYDERAEVMHALTGGVVGEKQPVPSCEHGTAIDEDCATCSDDAARMAREVYEQFDGPTRQHDTREEAAGMR
jgi:hypothetical protein